MHFRAPPVIVAQYRAKLLCGVLDAFTFDSPDSVLPRLDLARVRNLLSPLVISVKLKGLSRCQSRHRARTSS